MLAFLDNLQGYFDTPEFGYVHGGHVVVAHLALLSTLNVSVTAGAPMRLVHALPLVNMRGYTDLSPCRTLSSAFDGLH